MSQMGGFRPMMGLSSMAYQAQPQAEMQQQSSVQNQDQQVDWDNQFKEIEELTSKAEEKLRRFKEKHHQKLWWMISIKLLSKKCGIV